MLPGPHCLVVRSFKCGRGNNGVRSSSLNKSFLPSCSALSLTDALSVMAKPPFHNEGNNEIDPSKGKQECVDSSHESIFASVATLIQNSPLTVGHGQTLQLSLWIICPRSSCSIHDNRFIWPQIAPLFAPAAVALGAPDNYAEQSW